MEGVRTTKEKVKGKGRVVDKKEGIVKGSFLKSIKKSVSDLSFCVQPELRSVGPHLKIEGQLRYQNSLGECGEVLVRVKRDEYGTVAKMVLGDSDQDETILLKSSFEIDEHFNMDIEVEWIVTHTVKGEEYSNKVIGVHHVTFDNLKVRGPIKIPLVEEYIPTCLVQSKEVDLEFYLDSIEYGYRLIRGGKEALSIVPIRKDIISEFISTCFGRGKTHFRVMDYRLWRGKDTLVEDRELKHLLMVGADSFMEDKSEFLKEVWVLYKILKVPPVEAGKKKGR